MPTKTIDVRYLSRVEGEGSLILKMDGRTITDAKLRIFEPPRFFEALLRGRGLEEAPDITSRICGICPIAYQMSSVHAMERALGVSIEAGIADLRRLLYCGEWIESHALHVFMLHAPDFLGYPSAVAMARDHGDAVKRGLAIKKTGNALLTLLGGREIHPINVRIGGFYRIPPRHAFEALLPKLDMAREDTKRAIQWVETFTFPEFERDYEFVALGRAGRYPMCEGRVVSTRGLDVDQNQFEEVIEERQVPHSTALQARIKTRGPYLCGPMARLALNYDLLPDSCQELARKVGIAGGTRNPYKSIYVRLIEILFAIEEAIRIIQAASFPRTPFAASFPRNAVGRAATEAPRGLLFHGYSINAEGKIEEARIIPPTSQNQASIEEDLRMVASQFVDAPEDELRTQCERAIRNHDPCISCSTHFLEVKKVEAFPWDHDEEDK